MDHGFEFYSFEHGNIRDVSQSNHGTAMAGLLVAKGSGPMRAWRLMLSWHSSRPWPRGNNREQRQNWRYSMVQVSAGEYHQSLSGDSRHPQIASRSVAGAVEDALDAGIFVVAAAGNAGPHNSDVSTPTMSIAISVGAYDDFDTWLDKQRDLVDPIQNNKNVAKSKNIGQGSYILSTVSSDKSLPVHIPLER